MKADQDLLSRVELVEERTNVALGRTGNAGPGGAGPMTTFVYRPGGVTGGNVYGGPGTTGWAPLVAAVALTNGPFIVEVDDSLAPGTATIPAGTWNFRPAGGVWDGTIQGNYIDNGAVTALTITNGATINGLGTWRFLSITNNATAPLSLTNGAAFLFDFAIVAVSAASFLETNAFEGFIIAQNFATLRGISNTGGGILVLFAGANASFPANSVTFGAAGSCLFEITSAAGVVSTTTLGAGTPTFIRTTPLINEGLQAGTTTLVNGVSPSITGVSITATSRIVMSVKAVNASTAIANLVTTTRTNGTKGTGNFQITSVRQATLATETNDQSAVDWVIIETASSV